MDDTQTSGNFLTNIIDGQIANGQFTNGIKTRFPPEPNGYLHIGHAKSIVINFGLAAKYNGTCNLRFDDTNPVKEDIEYVESIKEDIAWLGFKWHQELYASDYFEQLYEWAIKLIKEGLAYVCDLNADEMREHRGTLTEPGKESPFRSRSTEENLTLFTEMRAGKYKDGEKTLRAKIDMSSGNVNMRDPVLYRIKHAHHHRTGDKWCIYPSYDFTHGQSDSLENITHSICTLEFEDHKPLYEWFIEKLNIFPSKQYEFARLNLNYTVMSKRKLLQLVQQKLVSGWDDPRMPTISGMRRRGFTPDSIKNFCDSIGVSKANSMVDYSMLSSSLREDLNKKATRIMAVFDPLKVIITNYPEGQVEFMTGVNNPEIENSPTREIPFSRELYIERTDFMEEASKNYFRLAPGKEVRFQHAYYILCTGFKKNEDGNIEEVYCTYDPATRGGWSKDGRKVKGTMHWVSVSQSKAIEVRLYDNLFLSEIPDKVEPGKEFTDNMNPNSLIITKAFVEPEAMNLAPNHPVQFLRTGYFCVDSKDSSPSNPIFNRTITLKDSWAKIENKAE